MAGIFRRRAIAVDAEPLEEALVARLAAGDETALDTILREHWSSSVGYASYMLESGDAAEDVVQEAVIRLWKQRARIDPKRPLRPLLFRIIRNLCLNDRRWGGVQRRLVARLRTASRPSPVPTPLELAAEGELSVAFRRALGELAPRRREVFVLVRFHGMTYADVSTAMGISPQTVANQMSGALSELRSHLDGFF